MSQENKKAPQPEREYSVSCCGLPVVRFFMRLRDKIHTCSETCPMHSPLCRFLSWLRRKG